MNAIVLISPRAQNQIDAIDNEIADRSPERADEFLNTVNAKIEQLAQFPEFGSFIAATSTVCSCFAFPFRCFPFLTPRKTPSRSSPSSTTAANREHGADAWDATLK